MKRITVWLFVGSLVVPIPGATLFAREKGKLAASDKLSQETWQGRKWIVKEYSCQSHVPQSAALCWTAWIYGENKRVGILTASTPATLVDRYAAPLRAMMQSVKFTPPSR